MHVSELLHKLFKPTLQNIDKRLQKTIVDCSISLSKCKQLSITAIGRNLDSKTSVKHNLKRVDRLFGNANIQLFTHEYYRAMAHKVIQRNTSPAISIDWPGLTPCGEFHFLRASVPVGGRAITLYEACFKESEYMNGKTHLSFLKTLQSILPENCTPIIVTDAGFRCPWFNQILAMNWHFIGRVRHTTQYKDVVGEKWLPVKSLYSKAKNKPEYLFSTRLAKANPVFGSFYLYKSKSKNRKRKNLRGLKIQCSVSLKHAKRGREPWLLFSSLPIHSYSAFIIKNLYSQRMQIEESFRDLKSTLNGLGFRHCRSYQKGRLNVALLLGAITFFMLWITGVVAKKKQIHRRYQANSIKHRNVLSTFNIGWHYLRDARWQS